MKISEVWIECARCRKPILVIPEHIAEAVLRGMDALDEVLSLEPGKAILMASHCLSCIKEGESSVAMFRFGIIKERPKQGAEGGATNA
jgi:hypothetical protein